MNTERKLIEMAEVIFHNKYGGQYSSWRANTLNPDGSVTLRNKWGTFLKTITPEELAEYEALTTNDAGSLASLIPSC